MVICPPNTGHPVLGGHITYSVDFLALKPGIISRWFAQCQPETFGGAAVPGKKQSHEELESFMAWAPYIQQKFGVKNSDAYVNTHLDEQADPWFRACLFYRRVVVECLRIFLCSWLIRLID